MADNDMPEMGQLVYLPKLDRFAQTGIYFLHHGGKVVYVGQAVDMRRRISDHIAEGSKIFDAISYALCSRAALDSMERHFIEKLVPKYNNCSLARSLRRLGIQPKEGPHVEFHRRRLPRSRKVVLAPH